MKFNNAVPYRGGNRRGLRPKRVGVILLVLLLVIAGGVVAWKMKQAHDIAVERARFAQADKDISQLLSQIPQPDFTNKADGCHYLSREFETKPIVCEVLRNSVYAMDTYGTANSLATHISQVFNNQSTMIFVPTKQTATPIYKDLNVEFDPRVSQPSMSESYRNVSSNLNCDVFYSIETKAQIMHDFAYNGLIKPFGLVLTINCGGSAKYSIPFS